MTLLHSMDMRKLLLPADKDKRNLLSSQQLSAECTELQPVRNDCMYQVLLAYILCKLDVHLIIVPEVT